MWQCTALATLAAAAGCAAVGARRARTVAPRSLSEQLEDARTVESLVAMLRSIAHQSPTDDLVARVVHAVRLTGISEGALERLSEMHREHGHSHAVEGYAINLVWSSITHAIQTEPVVITCA